MSILTSLRLRVVVSVLALGSAAAFAVTAPISLTIQAEHFSSKQGATFDVPTDKESRTGVLNFQNGNWIRFDSINFLAGEYDTLRLYYWSAWPQDASGASVRVRLDSPTGTIIGSFTNLAGTPDYGYETSTPKLITITRTTGVHSLVLTVEGGGGTILSMDRLRLSGTMTSSPGDAVTYYVSTTGDDGADGLSVDRPFKTIQKAASVMKPGSTCNIRQGVYRETVTPVYTGLPGAPLTFQAYNNENVVISGADPVTGWSTHQGSIYKAPMSWTIGRFKDQVLVDGKMAWVARSPNVDENYTPHEYLNWVGTGCYNWKPYQGELEPVAAACRVSINHESGPSGDVGAGDPYSMSISQDQGLTALPSSLFSRSAGFFRGGILTNHNYYWCNVSNITGSSSTASQTVLNLSGTNSAWQPWGGPGHISHVFGLLDAPNEWYRDSSSNSLYLWAPDGGEPIGHLVEAKKRVLGFDLRSKRYVNLTGIRMIATSMTLGEANNCIIDRCHFKYVLNGYLSQRHI
jgi:hypothetical protein